MEGISLFDSEKMEKNWEQNRKLLLHYKFFYNKPHKEYVHLDLKITISQQLLFQEPIAFFDFVMNIISHQKTLQEIKSL